MFSFVEYEYDRVFRQEQGITIFNQLGRVFIGQTVQPGTKKTVRVRNVTMAGGGGSAGFKQGMGCMCFTFGPLESRFKQEQGITIFYRLVRGFLGQNVQFRD